MTCVGVGMTDIYARMKQAVELMDEVLSEYVQWGYDTRDIDDLEETPEQEAIHDAFRSIDVMEQEDSVAEAMGLKAPFDPAALDRIFGKK